MAPRDFPLRIFADALLREESFEGAFDISPLPLKAVYELKDGHVTRPLPADIFTQHIGRIAIRHYFQAEFPHRPAYTLVYQTAMSGRRRE